MIDLDGQKRRRIVMAKEKETSTSRPKPGRFRNINEGTVKKGGVNKPPVSDPPPPPKGQDRKKD